jgi:hypothetical protein
VFGYYIDVYVLYSFADNGIGHTFIPDISDLEFDEDLNLVPVPPLD